MHNAIMGASLYVPANHRDLGLIANGDKQLHASSVIFCTEDAVSQRDLDNALFQLSTVLAQMRPATRTRRFVRVRNPEVLARVLAMRGAGNLDGFVLPKATHRNFAAYFAQVRAGGHLLMPTLETVEVFDDADMRKFLALIMAPEVKRRIAVLRIGGNDLLALLGLRRPRTMTIYRTPLGPVIARLVTTFRPHGFGLTAPVFEHLDLCDLLDQEVAEDLAHGMVGKTAIHPLQVAPIERHYQVTSDELAQARAIVREGSPAVFQMGNSMCEVATHRAWAERTIVQSALFGTRPGVPALRS